MRQNDHRETQMERRRKTWRDKMNHRKVVREANERKSVSEWREVFGYRLIKSAQ